MKNQVDADTGWPRLGRQLPRLALSCAAFAVASCSMVASKASSSKTATRGAAAAEPAPPLTIVIVTLDGVRWHEVFEGVDAGLAKERGVPPEDVVSASELMPNLHAIIATRGVALGAPGHGATISASGPNFVSLPGYAELLSGRRSTACRDNQCPGAGPTARDERARSVQACDPRDVWRSADRSRSGCRHAPRRVAAAGLSRGAAGAIAPHS